MKVGPASSARVVLALAFQASMVVVAVAVPVVLLMCSRGQQMCQLWIMAVTLCSYVFVFLTRIWRSWWFTTDLIRLSYGLLLAHYAANHVGKGNTVLILLLTTAWAAAYLGYSLALHRLHNGTERAVVDGELPSPCCHSKDRARGITYMIPVHAADLTVLWTALMAGFISVFDLTDEPLLPHLMDELDIFAILSFLGWIYVAIWVEAVGGSAMHGVLMKEPIPWLMVGLIPWGMVSPAVLVLSRALYVVLNWLLMMVLLAFLGYNLAVYVCYLQTAEAEPATPMRSRSSLGSSTLVEPVPGEMSVSEGAR